MWARTDPKTVELRGNLFPEMEMYASGLMDENGGTTVAAVVASTTTATAALDLSSQQQNSYIFGVTDDKV